MENFGLHDKIEIDNREFHVHTGTLLEYRKIISEVFEKGMFLISRECPINLRGESENINQTFLTTLTEGFHYKVMDELEALYQIESKLERYKHPRFNYQLGILFLKRNLYEDAIRQFRTSLEQDRQFREAYIGLGGSYLKSRQFDFALETFERSLAVNGKFPDFLNYLGITYLFTKDYDHSIALFKEAIRVNPNYLEAQFNLGVALYKSALQGVKDPRAVAVPARVSIYLKQVRELKKYTTYSWQKEFEQLNELLRSNNHKTILSHLEEFQLKLVDPVPEYDKIYEFYLRFLFGGKEFNLEVIQKYEPFFHMDYSDNIQQADYWNDRGIFNLIKSRGLYLQAMEELDKALTIAPGFREAQQHLERVKSHEKGFLILLRAILK